MVPKRRRSTRGSWSRGPVRMQTARTFFPTSIPAHRSIAAQIIFLFSFPAEEQPTSSQLSSSSARLLHSGIQHVGLASFVFGSTAPLPIPAAFFHLRTISHIFMGGGEPNPAHDSFVFPIYTGMHPPDLRPRLRRRPWR